MSISDDGQWNARTINELRREIGLPDLDRSVTHVVDEHYQPLCGWPILSGYGRVVMTLHPEWNWCDICVMLSLAEEASKQEDP